MHTDNTAAHAIRVSAVINILIGLWVFVTPWIYGAAWNNPTSWNAWLLGPLLVLLALGRWLSPLTSRKVGWLNMLLGFWLFLSPWALGYTFNSGRFVNNLCAGAVIFFVSLYGVTIQDRPASVGHR